MFFGMLNPGLRVSWSIGRPGEAQDVYPARVHQSRGRQVTLIVLRKNLADETFLDYVRTSDNFVDARDEIVSELDAPTLGQLLTTIAESKAQRQAQTTADAAI